MRDKWKKYLYGVVVADTCLTAFESEKSKYFAYDSLNPFPSSINWEAPCLDNKPGIQKSLR